MEIKITKEELDAMLRRGRGHISLNDPIFDRLYKKLGANPPKKRKDLCWQYERCTEPMQSKTEAKCLDFSNLHNRKAEQHSYTCMNCLHSLDYFVAGTEDWWCREMPNFCPNCGSELTEGSFEDE